MVKNLPANAEDIRDVGLIPGSRRVSEESMAAHCSIVTWRILWTEKPGVLQFMGSQRVGHSLVIKQQQMYIVYCSKLLQLVVSESL